MELELQIIVFKGLSGSSTDSLELSVLASMLRLCTIQMIAFLSHRADVGLNAALEVFTKLLGSQQLRP